MSAASGWRWRRAQLVERRGHELAAARLTSPHRRDRRQASSCWSPRRARSKARCGASRATRCRRSSAPLDRLEQFGERLQRCGSDLLQHGQRQVDQLGKLLESYSFHSVLNRGFALVRDQDGQPVLAAAGTQAGDTIGIEFADGRDRRAGDRGRPARAPRPARAASAAATAAAAIKGSLL